MHLPESSARSSTSADNIRVADLNAEANPEVIEQRIDAASDAFDQLGNIEPNIETGGTDQLQQPSTRPFQLDSLTQSAPPLTAQPIDVLGDVELDLRIELGRTQMSLQEVLQLRSGSVVALDTQAGDPVSVYVNGRIIARGEIVVMNDNFCVRVTGLVGS